MTTGLAEQRRIAYHEAGHIAAALRLQVPVKYATIISDDVRFDGRVIYPPSKHTPFVEAVILLAGCVAEARYLRKPIGSIVLNGSRSDLTQAAKALMSYSPPRLTLGYALEYTIELIAGEFYNNHVQTLAAAFYASRSSAATRSTRWSAMRRRAGIGRRRDGIDSLFRGVAGGCGRQNRNGLHDYHGRASSPPWSIYISVPGDNNYFVRPERNSPRSIQPRLNCARSASAAIRSSASVGSRASSSTARRSASIAKSSGSSNRSSWFIGFGFIDDRNGPYPTPTALPKLTKPTQ